jgi:hypothetical protein
MTDFVQVHCPWSFETVAIGDELDDRGAMDRDCEVCCNPWRVVIDRDEYGDPVVRVDRLD